MPAKRNSKINLLPHEGFETSTLGRILKWSLSTFRVMVIITELVVMGAFLSRFWLDAKNSDLNDELNNSKAQILAYSDIESSIRSNQNKLNIVKSLYAQKSVKEVVDNISKLIPPDISLTSITINDNLLNIKASSLSERSIMQFFVNLDENENLTDVNLSNVSSSVDNDYTTIFTITASVKGLIPAKGEK